MRADDDALRRWVENRRAAADRELEEAEKQGPLPPEVSLQRALRLVVLAAELHGWPFPESDEDRRQDEAAYDRWTMLRRRLARS